MVSLVSNNWAQDIKWLVLPTLDHGVLGLNPATAHDSMTLHFTEPFNIVLPSLYPGYSKNSGRALSVTPVRTSVCPNSCPGHNS